jgi:hypothetical protein
MKSYDDEVRRKVSSLYHRGSMFMSSGSQLRNDSVRVRQREELVGRDDVAYVYPHLFYVADTW